MGGGGVNCDCFGILFCVDIDFMDVSCLWSFMCFYLLSCDVLYIQTIITLLLLMGTCYLARAVLFYILS
jgi:hypothetical protein